MSAETNIILKKFEEFRTQVELSLQEIGELDITCKSILRVYVIDTNAINVSAIVNIQAVIDRMYERVNIGNWKEVPRFIRKSITVASYVRLLAAVKFPENEDILKELFKIIDFGIMFGCQLDAAPQVLQKCASLLNTLQSQHFNQEDSCIPNLLGTRSLLETKQLNTINIEEINCPSMECFYKDYILADKPVVLNNCMNHWPALTKWKDQNYFIKLAGYRTVAVELGSKYTDADWTQELMTIEEFIKGYIYETNGPTGYLAQYQLFDQIPELKEDIVKPEYCCFSKKDDPVDINAWYGPKGTISPLHHDPKKNLLTQVIGEKQLFLFSPLDTECLYPHGHKLLTNTAQVDPRQPDFEKYPKYKNAKVYYCRLRAGQMLYIPPKWWHFVESLSISFSVSFWWE